MIKNEIDLHGLTVIEAIEELTKFYNRRVLSGNKSCIEVIHGYGSTGTGGVLRNRIRGFLARNQEYLRFETGESSISRNPGKTMVYPIIALSDSANSLAEEILDYCETARSLSKISGKFRRYGDEKMKSSLKILEKQNELNTFYKNQIKHYQARRAD